MLFFQRVCNSLLSALLLRHQREEEGRVLVRALPKRRTPNLERAGLHAHVQRGALLRVPAPHAGIYVAQGAAGVAGRLAAAQAHYPLINSIFLLTVTELLKLSPHSLTSVHPCRYLPNCRAVGRYRTVIPIFYLYEV